MSHQKLFIVPVQKCSCETCFFYICVRVLELIRLLSISHSFFTPPLSLAHSSLCVCMCLITRGPPLPSACHMVHSFASFDMQRLKNVFIPVGFFTHFMVLQQPEFRHMKLRVVNKRHKITFNNKKLDKSEKSRGFF